jgi:uncharacterized phage protein (TIGR01671 family)
MRDILFKGKETNKDKWAYGVPIKATSIDESEMLMIENVFECEEYVCRGCNFTPVIPESISEFTGLTDKNGKKIFEEDIVKIYLYEPKGLANYEIGCIKYDDTKARFVFCTEEGKYGIDNSNVFEVIGNIHDNPELLKGGERG